MLKVFGLLLLFFAAVVSAEDFSENELASIEAGREQFQFQAQVDRLMSILTEHLYSNREIFLRELISNAADALDKIRFVKLEQGVVLPDEEFHIRVKADKEAKTLTITDTGVGMTRDELIRNLGTVAKSGTTDFVESAMKNKGDNSLSLIGQFGVGFYSVYLVADKVTVISKSDNDTQYIWESSAQKTFTLVKDPRGNTLERGTQIILTLKEDAEEFFNENTLESLISRYSSFITHPISLWTSRSVTKEVPVEEEPKPAKTDDELEVTEEDEVVESAKTKTITELVSEWKRINTAKAIWARNPSDVTPREYEDFFQTLAKSTKQFMTKIHFSAEGEISFRSILYVPKQADEGLYEKFYEKSTALKLYVRKVLISDEFDDFLPRYLSFIKGVVDSDDLPLNVNRETLAQNRVLKVMSKKITRKVLEMLKRLADQGKEGTDVADEEDAEIGETFGDTTYAEFWAEYGKSIKLGVMDDRANRNKLLRLIRFTTSKSKGELTSLEEYTERMGEAQKEMYYITGESIESVSNSPFLEKVKKLDLEVIYFVDPLDEYLVQTLNEFEGNKLVSVMKADLKLDEDEEAEKESLKEEFQPLISYLTKTYGKRVEKIVLGSRITESPAILVTDKYGWTSNMERIMKAQTFVDPKKGQFMASKRIMEINPKHAIIREFNQRIQGEGEQEASSLVDLADLVYDAALVSSGFSIDNVNSFTSRLHRIISLGLGLEPEPVAPADASEPEPVAAEPVVENNGHDEL